MTLQDKLYTLFEAPNRSRASLILNTVIYILIIISIVNLMLATVPIFQEKYGYIFLLVRNIVMPIFIVEYVLRLYASGSLDKYKGLGGKFKYAITPYAMIDLLSILPYLLVNMGFNSSFIRSLRLLRIFRLLRVRKYAIFIQSMKKIFSNIKEQLIVLLFFTVIIIIILSFIIYHVEHEAQPEVFSNMFQTMWWSVATLTTVGYGDMYPITTVGKTITGIVTIVGISFIAIPGGLFASEFMAVLAEGKVMENDENEKCLKCGSSSINVYADPTLKYSEEISNFETVSICDECQFTWLD